jgi:hypothetical protein
MNGNLRGARDIGERQVPPLASLGELLTHFHARQRSKITAGPGQRLTGVRRS